MRTWLLLALLGLVLLVSMTYREGVDDTMAPMPTCAAAGTTLIEGWCQKPRVPATPATCPAGTTLNTNFRKCFGPASMTQAQASAAGLVYSAITNQYSKEAVSTCPDGYTLGLGDECVDSNATRPVCSSGYSLDIPSGKCKSTSPSSNDPFYTSGIDSCNIYWDAAITSWAAGNAAASDASSTCLQYAPSWVAALSSTGNLLDSAGKPTAATKAQAIIEKQQDTDYDAQQTEAAGYAASTGYAAVEAAALAGASGGQSLTPPIDESPDSDIGAVRPTGGTVFTGPNSPYTNQSGTGQGSAAAAAAGMAGGNTYGSGAGYSSSTVAGNTGLTNGLTVIKPATNMDLQVGGPKYGGLGAPIASSSSGSYETGPVLYGPKAAQNKNIDTTNWTPSYWSVGSAWNSMFAGTSRVPGDQDLIPNPYLQSTAYSLANGSQKTNPVPFLSDFSAFQS